jgi:hypothetical protein
MRILESNMHSEAHIYQVTFKIYVLLSKFPYIGLHLNLALFYEQIQ